MMNGSGIMEVSTLERLKNEREGKQKRLDSYYQRELDMLSPDGVQSYGVGSRNLSRYTTALNDVRSAIKELERDIAQLDRQLGGGSPRKAVSAVPRDW